MFIEGERVMIMNGSRCGEFARVCSSLDGFTAVYFQGETLVYLDEALKRETECVFTAADMGEEDEV